MARSVPDAAAFAAILEGTAAGAVQETLRPPRFGLCRSPAWPEIEADGSAGLEAAATRIRAADGIVRELRLPRCFDDAPAAQMAIMAYEGARDLAAEREAHWDQIGRAHV